MSYQLEPFQERRRTLFSEPRAITRLAAAELLELFSLGAELHHGGEASCRPAGGRLNSGRDYCSPLCEVIITALRPGKLSPRSGFGPPLAKGTVDIFWRARVRYCLA